MSSRNIFAAAILCLSACATKPNLPEVPDSIQRLYILGASAPAPQEKGWYADIHTPYHIGIIKLGKTKDATVAVELQDFKLSPPQPSEDFATLVKEAQEKDSDPNRFTVQVLDVTQSKLGQAVCARLHSVSLDKQAKTPTGKTTEMVLEVYALNCRHPEEPTLGINASYSLRYHEGDRDSQLDQMAAAFMDGVQIVPVKK